jgi:hypothetical protein
VAAGGLVSDDRAPVCAADGVPVGGAGAFEDESRRSVRGTVSSVRRPHVIARRRHHEPGDFDVVDAAVVAASRTSAGLPNRLPLGPFNRSISIDGSPNTILTRRNASEPT